MTLTWGSIQEGDALPELRKKPGLTQLVKYAAGGGDFNPLHHDYAFPQAKALGSIIVHGRFKYASLSSWSRTGSVTRAGSASSPASIAAWTSRTRRSSSAAR